MCRTSKLSGIVYSALWTIEYWRNYDGWYSWIKNVDEKIFRNTDGVFSGNCIDNEEIPYSSFSCWDDIT